MGSYYYLMAQLPYLYHDQKPPMSSGEFKDLARPFLTKRDNALLEGLTLDPDRVNSICSDSAEALDDKTAEPKTKKVSSSTGCKFIDNWNGWERSLRINLAKYRSKKLHRDIEDHPVNQQSASYSISFSATLKDASAVATLAVNHEGTPLEDEIFIDRERWITIDSLAGNDYFSRDNVFAYYLKILLLERHILFNEEIGFSEYKKLYAQIIESPHEYVNNDGHNSTGEYK